MALAREERWQDAIVAVNQALALDPDSSKGVLLLGTALWRLGRADESLRQYERAIEIDPSRAEAHYSLSLALFLQGRYQEAVPRFERAFAIAPRWGRLPDAYDAGVALRLPQPPRVAAEAASGRLAQEPGDVAALLVLASLRSAARDPGLRDAEEALRLARRACSLTRFQIPEAIDVLAAAHAEAGRFEDAVRLGRFVAWYAGAADRKLLAAGAAERLALYERGQPYRRAD